MKKKIILILLIAMASATKLSAEEILFYGSVPQVNEINVGGYTVKILKGDQKENAVNWNISAKQNEITYLQPLNRSGSNFFVFPDSILEIQSSNVPTIDRWNCMAENVGEYRIIKKNVGELPAKFISSVKKSILFDKETLKMDNGLIELEICPSINGAIVGFTDKMIRNNWFYLNDRTMSAADRNSFQGVGFVELINAYGNAVGNPFETEIGEKADSCVVKMKALSRKNQNVKLDRIIEVENSSTLFSVKSILTETSSQEGLFRLKHRPEMRIGGDVSGGDCVYVSENGSFKEVPLKQGEIYVKGNSLAAIDKDKGFLMAVIYEKNDLETIYLWVDSEKINLEAWTIERSLKTPLALDVTYYLIKGMDKVSNLNKNAVISVSSDKPWHTPSEILQLNTALGIPGCAEDINVKVTLTSAGGEKVREINEKIDKIYPGIAVQKQFKIPLNGMKEGEYAAKVEVFHGANLLIEYSQSVRIIESQLLKYSEILSKMESELSNMKNKIVSESDSAGKSVLMKKFAAMSQIKQAFARQIKNGTVENPDDIYKKFNEAGENGKQR